MSKTILQHSQDPGRSFVNFGRFLYSFHNHPFVDIVSTKSEIVREGNFIAALALTDNDLETGCSVTDLTYIWYRK